MKFIRIVAKHKDNKNETITILGCWDEATHYVDGKVEMFGKVKDCNESGYINYPFHTRSAGSNELFLCFGGEYEDKSTINILGRRLAPGEEITRIETLNGQVASYSYEIANIHEY